MPPTIAARVRRLPASATRDASNGSAGARPQLRQMLEPVVIGARDLELAKKFSERPSRPRSQ